VTATAALLILANGLVDGATLFLVAVGLNLIFGVAGVLNVAHGSFYALGAFSAATAWAWIAHAHAPPWLVYPAFVAAAGALGVALGPAVERVLVRPTYAAGAGMKRESLQLLTTYALFLVLEDVQKMVWGVQPYYTGEVLLLAGRTRLGGVLFTNYQLLLLPAAGAVLLGLRYFLRRTTTGRFVVAVTETPEMAAALGIDVGGVRGASFALGTALAALGGALSSPEIGVAVGIGADMVVLSFAVAAVAGLGRIEGAAVAALLIGVARAAAVFVVPELSSVAPYLIMLAVLLVKPYGLAGAPEKRRL
jgi:branched-chain amino acid transport system permease protein